MRGRGGLSHHPITWVLAAGCAEAVLNQELGCGSRELPGRGCQQASSVPGLM